MAELRRRGFTVAERLAQSKRWRILRAETNPNDATTRSPRRPFRELHEKAGDAPTLAAWIDYETFYDADGPSEGLLAPIRVLTGLDGQGAGDRKGERRGNVESFGTHVLPKDGQV